MLKKYGTAIYKVKTTGSGLLVLDQGFEKGWISYPKLTHVKVNSWANGWVVPPTFYILPATVYLFFWPQLLEWSGFIILIITLISLTRLTKKN